MERKPRMRHTIILPQGVDATPATGLRSEPRGWVTGCALKATSLATSRPRDAGSRGARNALNACGASVCVRERRATASAANARTRAVRASSRFAASASAILDARTFPKRLSKLGDL
eukprot:scaffold17606_cov225-Isochrysis_galbana.AAC.4